MKFSLIADRILHAMPLATQANGRLRANPVNPLHRQTIRLYQREVCKNGGHYGDSGLQSCCGIPEERETEDEGMRGVHQERRLVDASAHVPDVWEGRLLRLVKEPSRAGALS